MNHEMLWELHKQGFDDSCTITVGSRTFKASKLILISQSTYFKNTLQVNTNNLFLDSTTPEVMEQVLEYCYRNKVNNIDLYSVKVFVAALDLGIEGLKNLAADSLGRKVNQENILSLLELAFGRNDAYLKSKIWAQMTNYPSGIFRNLVSSNEWNSFQMRNPQRASEILNATFQALGFRY